jgi:hypothetical protein
MKVFGQETWGKDLSLDGRIVLKLIFNKWNGVARTGIIWLRTGTGGRLRTCDFLKKDCSTN